MNCNVANIIWQSVSLDLLLYAYHNERFMKIVFTFKEHVIYTIL